MHYIYLVTNTNSGKAYVGQSISPKARWAAHRAGWHAARLLLHRAVIKHGAAAFTFRILEQAQTATEANNAERSWIESLGTLSPKGYNVSPGGSSCGPETREKLRKALLGVKHTDERRRNESAAHIGQRAWNKGLPRELNPQTGRRRSEDTRRRMSETAKARNTIANLEGKRGRVKITRDDAESIRRLHAEGRTAEEIMAMYPIGKNQVRNIIRRISWR